MTPEPKPDDIPEPDAEVKDEKKEERPRINVQYESPVYSTNKMSAEEAERAIRFLLEHGRPGTGQVGSKPSSGGGGGGGGSGKTMAGNTASSARSPNTHTRLERCAKRARLFSVHLSARTARFKTSLSHKVPVTLCLTSLQFA